MIARSAASLLALALVAVPLTAQAASDPSSSGTDAPEATGSPSAANATVSAATVAAAAVRTDDRLSAGTGISSLGVSLGTSYAAGNFGTAQNSTLWSTALGIHYAVGTLRLSASMPYLRIRGRGLIFSGIDGTPLIVSGGTPGRKVTNDGIGDLTLGAAYTLPVSDGQPEIELSGRVKIPTATDASQLSTGKTDYSAGVQITKPLGRFAPFVSGTYRIFGDTALVDLRDGFAASAGTSLSLGSRSVALVSYHYARAATRLVRDSHEVFAGASTRFPGSALRATAYATAGLSSGAAAASGGLSLAVEF